jgi:hypothetical protein
VRASLRQADYRPKGRSYRKKELRVRDQYFYINTFFLAGKVSRIAFYKKTGYIDKSTIPALLAYGAPNPKWGRAYQDLDGNSHWISSSKDLFASLADSWMTFVLWTRADRDAIRAAQLGKGTAFMTDRGVRRTVPER